MAKLFPELFPDDGKNRYRYILVLIALIALLIGLSGNGDFEYIFLILLTPVGCWLIVKFASKD